MVKCVNKQCKTCVWFDSAKDICTLYDEKAYAKDWCCDHELVVGDFIKCAMCHKLVPIEKSYSGKPLVNGRVCEECHLKVIESRIKECE